MVVFAGPFADKQDMTQTEQHNLMNNYARLPVTMVRGKGAWLWDDQGKRYLDALSGIGVCALGHAHPAVTAAIVEPGRNPAPLQ